MPQQRVPRGKPEGGQYASGPVTDGIPERDRYGSPPVRTSIPNRSSSGGDIARKALNQLPNLIPLGSVTRLEKIVDLSHGPQVVAAIQENYEHLGPWFAWAANRDVELLGFKAWFDSRKVREEAPVDYSVMVDGQVRGRFSAWRNPAGAIEFGYWLSREQVGKGLISSSLREVEDRLATGGASVFEVHWAEGNARSARVAERAGYRIVGTYMGRPSNPNVRHVFARKWVGAP